MNYWHRDARGTRVEYTFRGDAIAGAVEVVRNAMLFRAVYVWTDEGQIVALVTKNEPMSDEQLRERHGEFVQVVRV